MIKSTKSISTGDPGRLRQSIAWASLATAVLWVVKIFENVSGVDFSSLGVYPWKATGLLGILFAPLIHGSWLHLAANSGPVLILLTALLYGYPRSSKFVLPVVYFGTGLAVWLTGREVYHIGASGVTFGMLFFITAIGFIRRDKQAIGLALAVFFLYGGMMGGLFPEDRTISYETHIAAACLGIVLAMVLRKLDPAPPPKVYSWELEEDDDDDAWWESEWQDDVYDKPDMENGEKRDDKRLH